MLKFKNYKLKSSLSSLLYSLSTLVVHKSSSTSRFIIIIPSHTTFFMFTNIPILQSIPSIILIFN
ncbi:hypothetical protein Hanom_Chr05g00427221 [Helianthus anomalus]